MKHIHTFILLSCLATFGVADEITGLNLRAGGNSQPVNPTAVAGAVLSLDSNKRPTFGGGIGIDSTGILTFNSNAYFGSPSAATLRLGGAASATPVAQTLTVQPASGANIAGADFTIKGSESTGSGLGGNILFKTSRNGGAGSGQNTATTIFEVGHSKVFLKRGELEIDAAGSAAPGLYVKNIGANNMNYGIYCEGGSTSSDYAFKFDQKGGTQLLQLRGDGLLKIGTNAGGVSVSPDSAATLQLGADHATTPTAQTLKAHDVTTGVGASMTIAGGTGSVAGGDVSIATSATNGTPILRVIVHEGAVAASNTVAATLATISCADGKTVGGELLVTVEAEESGHVTSITEHSTFTAVSYSGVTTPAIQAAPSTSTAATTNAGTLTLTHGISAPGGNTFTITVTPTSSYGGPTITIRYQLRLNASDSGTQVTLP